MMREAMMETAKDKKKDQDKAAKKKEHVCTICGRPSPLTICHACEDKVRGEMLEHQHGIHKAGRTDSGRR